MSCQFYVVVMLQPLALLNWDLSQDPVKYQMTMNRLDVMRCFIDSA